jgi:hypothetical protein
LPKAGVWSGDTALRLSPATPALGLGSWTGAGGYTRLDEILPLIEAPASADIVENLPYSSTRGRAVMGEQDLILPALTTTCDTFALVDIYPEDQRTSWSTGPSDTAATIALDAPTRTAF